jgi:ABC-type nitrate/sulfonate/bicarbonate transport system substrate-binding protein
MALTAGIAAVCAGLSHKVVAQDSAPFEITYAYGWISNIEQAPLWAALDQGYFEQEGLAVDYIPGGPNAPQTLVSLSADSADIVTANWLPILDAIAEGNDFVILGAMWETSPAALLTLGDLPLDTPEALVGKRILAQKPSDSDIIDAILDSAGLPHDYTMVPTGFSPEPLIAGDGDVYFAFATNQPITLEKMGMVEGEDFHTTLLADLGYEVKQGLIVAKRSLVEENPDEVAGFLRAMMKGWRYAIDNPGAVRDLVVNEYGADLGLDPEQQLRQMELQAPLVTPAEGNMMFVFDPEIISGAMTTAAADRTIPPLEELLYLEPARVAAEGL